MRGARGEAAGKAMAASGRVVLESWSSNGRGEEDEDTNEGGRRKKERDNCSAPPKTKTTRGGV